MAKVLAGDPPDWPGDSTALNPFIRYRQLLYSYDVVSGSGRNSDVASAFGRTVGDLDDAIFAVCGQRFRITPFARRGALSDALGFSRAGGVWVKDETGNVSGSHKGRHLAGIMLCFLHIRPDERPDLAIASCGNAALAAAVIARAAQWPLKTFVPPDANPEVVNRLKQLGAAAVTCPRRPGEVGDPCYHRFREALASGAVPFCCQGPDNGLTIEGGETLAYEIVDQLAGTRLDAVVVQVGGGALASACVQGFERAVALGRLPAIPRIFTVQTQGAAPLARAFERVAARVAQHGIADALAYAATHRSEFMWPWEREPRSIARSILDDETYDWLAVVKGMLETGGRALVVDEDALEAANRQARDTTGVDVDHTGSAGLAGLVALRASGEVSSGDNVAVIFSGVRRSPSPARR
ncbi:MAG TPA: PLP-dependent lyase/thiolase [Gemmatimonadaceae bacterium]